jgi:hypothetical protein
VYVVLRVPDLASYRERLSAAMQRDPIEDRPDFVDGVLADAKGDLPEDAFDSLQADALSALGDWRREVEGLRDRASALRADVEAAVTDPARLEELAGRVRAEPLTDEDRTDLLGRIEQYTSDFRQSHGYEPGGDEGGDLRRLNEGTGFAFPGEASR